MSTPVVALGVTGVLLTTFSDFVVKYTTLRVFVFSCLMVVYAVCLLVRRAASNPLTSFGVTTMTAAFTVLSSFFGWSRHIEALDQFAVIAAVLCVLFSTMAAVYFDSVLERKLQKIVVMCSGLTCCIIAATLDYPEYTVLTRELISGFILALTRILIWTKLRWERPSVKKVAESDTDRSVEEQETAETSPLPVHPLILKGMILNPKTDRIIMIGKKTYETLLMQGYKPDFRNGVLVKNESCDPSVH